MPAIHAYTELKTDLARRWDEFVDRHPHASLYHHSRWVSFAAEAFGFDAAWLTCEAEAGRLTGVLPMIRQRSRLFGDRWVSLPFFNYGGPLAADGETALALIAKAAWLARETGVRALEIRDIEPRAGLAVRTDKAAMVLALPDSSDALAKVLGAKLRSQIRRADREGPEIVHGGADLVADFHGVFAGTMRNLGTPALPREFFEEMFRRVGGDCRIVIVRLAGLPAAAGLLTSCRGTLEIPWAGSLHRFRSVAVNMRLYSECMKFAIESGHRRFDFGRSTVGGGTFRFKQQWGARPETLHWIYPLHRAGAMTTGTGGSFTQFARMIWRCLPVAVATRLARGFSPGLPW